MSQLYFAPCEPLFLRCSHATLNKAWAAADIAGKWAASAWAKKIAAQQTKAGLTDFQRFQTMLARKTVCLSMCV